MSEDRTLYNFSICLFNNIIVPYLNSATLQQQMVPRLWLASAGFSVGGFLRLYSVEWQNDHECCTGKGVKENSHALQQFWGIIQAFAWRDWGIPQMSSVMMIDLWAEKKIQELPNMK
jgi:hypothetical protein